MREPHLVVKSSQVNTPNAKSQGKNKRVRGRQLHPASRCKVVALPVCSAMLGLHTHETEFRLPIFTDAGLPLLFSVSPDVCSAPPADRPKAKS
jgi:hypothetical protein